MGVIRNSNISSKERLGLWALDEPSSSLLQRLRLTSKEKEALDRLKAEVRKRQFLASRLLLRELTGYDQIEYDKHGKPYIEGRAVHISISHSEQMVAVVASNYSITGIDIQSITEKISNIRFKFLSAEELKDISEIDIEKLHVYWGAKESLYKAYGKQKVIFNEHLFVSPFTYLKKGEIIGSIQMPGFNRTFRLRYEKLDQYMLVYIMNG